MSQNLYDNLLTKEDINNFWKFIDVFRPKINENNIMESSVLEYRDNLIKKIQKKYTIEEFYKNDLFYKLRIKYTNFIKEQQKNIKEQNVKEQNVKEQNVKDKIKMDASYSHKMLLYHEKSKQLFINNSSPILQIIASLLRDRKTYESAMTDTTFKYYYQDDYAFPNVNLMFYNDNSKKLWMKNIKRLYYVKNCNDNWYKNPYLSVQVDSLLL